MGHRITAIIGSGAALAGLADRSGPAPTALPFDLVIVPLGPARLDMLAQENGPPHDGFAYLGPALEIALARAVGTGPALYIETDYFGGRGTQGAAWFAGGEAGWRDAEAHEDGGEQAAARPGGTPISRGLAELGVRPPAEGDEFDAVGLGRFRSMRALGLDE